MTPRGFEPLPTNVDEKTLNKGKLSLESHSLDHSDTVPLGSGRCSRKYNDKIAPYPRRIVTRCHEHTASCSVIVSLSLNMPCILCHIRVTMMRS